MLRLTVIVLLLANAGYYAWSQGHLAEWGLAPAPQGEPQRLQQQIRPEAVRLAGEPA
ncbi:MAG TPA: SPOR domain-containing protein, partial [Giesbergeria sp.]|nr:SPOR domain-containing protein [Giesbergeria sp.]